MSRVELVKTELIRLIEDLPAGQADWRSELEIVWMQDDIEMQLAIDRSDTMTGDPLANAQEAAKTLEMLRDYSDAMVEL